MSKTFTKDGTLEERVSSLEKYLEDLSLHRDSRRGLEGPRGPQGEPGIGIPGPAGKDADIKKVIYAAEEEMHAVLEQVIANLPETILWELQLRGVVDHAGRAILLPGPAGRDGAPGADSQVAGPPGRDGADGKSIVGPPGRDAKIQVGSVSSGEVASVSLREEDGVQILDIVLPRGERGETGPAGRDGADSQVPGPIGPEGLQGIPGKGVDKQAVVDIVLDLKRRQSI
jgi:hypothetical protein